MYKKGLALAIVILFFGAGIVSAFNVTLDNEPKPLNRGNWLYVGGSGEGNYSKIQDAIDNVSDGDTIFVYDDNSPYFELLVVDKSISLVGESVSTIIEGNGSQDVITIISDGVTICSFTIQINGPGDAPNINVKSNSIVIKNNIIKNSRREGIRLYGVNNILISNNTLKNNIFPIHIGDSKNISIISNIIYTISNSGILSDNANNLSIFGNTFYNSWLEYDVKLFDNGYVTIERNTFNSLYNGILIERCKKCIVSENNFINENFTLMVMYFCPPIPRKTNIKIDGNYWYKPRVLPKLIIGCILPSNELLAYLLLGSGIFPPYPQIDWHPAKEPFRL
jgi:parallel beta-helix repeat protein